MHLNKIQETFTPLQQSGTRIDKLLAQNFTQITRENFKKEIKGGNVLVNGEKTKPNYVTREHDKIEVDISFQETIRKTIANSNIEINVLYEHSDFLIIEKPAGISVHPSEKEPDETLENGLIAKFPKLQNIGENPMRPGIVHRLDKYTSGLLIVPKNQTAFDFFKDLFKNHGVIKQYSAICWGTLSKKEGLVSLYIGRSKSNPLKQSTSKYASKLGSAKQALTKYKLQKESLDKTKSLILTMPKTGRKHQIRVHLHSIGHPIVGDKMYQLEKHTQENKDFKRFLLHASQLKFSYADGKKYEFNSPIPEEFFDGF